MKYFIPFYFIYALMGKEDLDEQLFTVNESPYILVNVMYSFMIVLWVSVLLMVKLNG